MEWLLHYTPWPARPRRGRQALFLILQACLGMEILAVDRVLQFVHPMLPESIPNVRIRGLQVGSAVVDLKLTRDHETVGISQSRRVGEVQIIMVQ